MTIPFPLTSQSLFYFHDDQTMQLCSALAVAKKINKKMQDQNTAIYIGTSPSVGNGVCLYSPLSSLLTSTGTFFIGHTRNIFLQQWNVLVLIHVKIIYTCAREDAILAVLDLCNTPMCTNLFRGWN